jgi:hypothetical protein
MSRGRTRDFAVPVDELYPYFSGVQSYRELPATLCGQVAHFFRHYKDLEPGKLGQYGPLGRYRRGGSTDQGGNRPRAELTIGPPGIPGVAFRARMIEGDDRWQRES